MDYLRERNTIQIQSLIGFWKSLTYPDLAKKFSHILYKTLPKLCTCSKVWAAPIGRAVRPPANQIHAITTLKQYIQKLSLKCSAWKGCIPRLQWKSSSPKQILGPKKVLGPKKIIGPQKF